MTTDDKRQAATAQFRRANHAINTVFDRADELREALQGVSAAAVGPDVVRAAQDVLDRQERLPELLAALRTAADDASTYRSKADIAVDIDTKAATLFPRDRAVRPSPERSLAPPASPSPVSPLPAAGVA